MTITARLWQALRFGRRPITGSPSASSAQAHKITFVTTAFEMLFGLSSQTTANRRVTMIERIIASVGAALIVLAGSAVTAHAGEDPDYFRTAKCHPYEYARLDPSDTSRHEPSLDERPKYAFLYWYEYGLAETLKDADRAFGIYNGTLLYCKSKNRYRCFLPDDVAVDKSLHKDGKKLNSALLKGNAKEAAKRTARLTAALPERLPVESLLAYAREHTTCGFTRGMLADFESGQQRVALAALQQGTPEQLAKQARCDTAYMNYENALKTRPKSIYLDEHAWARVFKERRDAGKFCYNPPPSLVSDTPMPASDPYADMPLDMGGERWLGRMADVVNRTNPSDSDCSAAYNATQMMLNGGRAKLRPDEKAWRDAYAKTSWRRCGPIPERLAAWGDERVARVGWTLADSVTIDRETCDNAIAVIAERNLGGEYARWAITQRAMSHAETGIIGRRYCVSMPGWMKTELQTAIDQRAARLEQERLQAERDRRLAAASRPQVPTLQQMIEDYNRNWRPPTIIEERCYINQWGREHCYTRR